VKCVIFKYCNALCLLKKKIGWDKIEKIEIINKNKESLKRINNGK